MGAPGGAAGTAVDPAGGAAGGPERVRGGLRRVPGGRRGQLFLAILVVGGAAMRLYTRSDLWLDEALSVNIARLAPGELFDALARDGHPPFYYLLLHGWISVFGESDIAVRSLSALFGLVSLPLVYLVGREVGGRRTGVVALVLAATSPFAIRYATETRMYSLVMVLVLVGWLSLRATLERPTAVRVIGVALASGLLALSHYWSFYLLAAVAGALGLAWRRGRSNAGAALVALAGGALVFLPWLPTFLEQASSTGTPWGRPERPTVVLMISLTDWGGGPFAEAQLLGLLLLVLAAVALLGRAPDRHRLELDLRTVPGVRVEAGIVVATILLAVAAGYATDGAFASRYTAVIFPLVLVLAAYGLTRLPGTSWLVLLAVMVALASVGDVRNVLTQRTQAGEIAAYIVDNGEPGDLVAYCPDQLGPAVSRLLPADRIQRTYPAGAEPTFVDWADYADKQEAGDPAELAEQLMEEVGEGTLWLVWQSGYRTLESRCEELANSLASLRPPIGVVESGTQFEHATLYQYGPGRG